MQYPDKRIHFAIAALLFCFLTLLNQVFPGFVGDTESWKYWAQYINEFGLKNAYGSGTNYPPLYQFVLWMFGKLAGSPEAVGQNIGFLRVFTLAADYWALWMVYRWIDRRIDYVYLLLGSLLNIAYSYNTLVWGQVDAIFAALALASFFQLYKGKRIMSAVFMVLALNMKLQAIIFVPMWGLLMISSLHRDRRWKDLLIVLPVVAFLQAFILLPFVFGKGGLLPVWNAVAGLAATYPYTSLNAFNMWYWIIPEKDHGSDAVQTMLGLSYYHIGLISFCIASAVTLWPLLRHTVRTLLTRTTAPLPKEAIWLTAALLALAFFFFSTRMHERYAHAAFIFFTAYAFYRGRFCLYALFSLAYLLNLDKVLRGLKLPLYNAWFFDERFIAALFATCIVLTGIQLYRTVSQENKAEKLLSQPHLRP